MGLNLKTTTGKVVASLALVGTAAAVAGLGTYGAFTSTTSASASVGSGNVNIALGATGTAANRLSVGATGLVPGDSIQRAVTLTNAAGNQNLASISLTSTAPTSSVLDSPATVQNLQLSIDACSVPWTETAVVTGGFTYTCTGSGAATTTVLASRAVLGANIALPALTATTAGSTDNLRVTVTLPTGAGNDLQNKSSVIDLAFTGNQRTATAK